MILPYVHSHYNVGGLCPPLQFRRLIGKIAEIRQIIARPKVCAGFMRRKYILDKKNHTRVSPLHLKTISEPQGNYSHFRNEIMWATILPSITMCLVKRLGPHVSPINVPYINNPQFSATSAEGGIVTFDSMECFCLTL